MAEGNLIFHTADGIQVRVFEYLDDELWKFCHKGGGKEFLGSAIRQMDTSIAQPLVKRRSMTGSTDLIFGADHCLRHAVDENIAPMPSEVVYLGDDYVPRMDDLFRSFRFGRGFRYWNTVYNLLPFDAYPEGPHTREFYLELVRTDGYDYLMVRALQVGSSRRLPDYESHPLCPQFLSSLGEGGTVEDLFERQKEWARWRFHRPDYHDPIETNWMSPNCWFAQIHYTWLKWNEKK